MNLTDCCLKNVKGQNFQGQDYFQNLKKRSVENERYVEKEHRAYVEPRDAAFAVQPACAGSRERKHIL